MLVVAGCGSDDNEASGTTAAAAATTGPGAPAAVPDVARRIWRTRRSSSPTRACGESVKYVPSTEPRGQVIGQSRPPGTELQRGDAVSLNVSIGPNPREKVTVPDATEQTEAEGRAALEQAGLEVLTIKIPAVTEDTVVSHSPASSDRVPRGSLVLLYVGA